MNINWKKKLASRKFWALLAGLGTSVFVLVGLDSTTTTQIAGCVTALGSVAVYMLSEAYVDGQAVSDSSDDEEAG